MLLEMPFHLPGLRSPLFFKNCMAFSSIAFLNRSYDKKIESE